MTYGERTANSDQTHQHRLRAAPASPPDTTTAPTDRLARLAHAAARMHLAISRRQAVRTMPIEVFRNPDGSEDAYPMLTPDDYAATLDERAQGEYRAALDRGVPAKRAA